MQWHLRFLLFSLLLSPLPSHAFSEEDAMRLCMVNFQWNQWHYVHDAEALAVAHEVLADSGSNLTPVICGGDGGKYELAAVQYITYNGVRYMFIGIHLPLRSVLGDGLRGLIAHEVAHRIKEVGACNVADVSEVIACELAIDREAERIVGKGEMVRTHNAVILFLEGRSKHNIENEETILRIIRARRDGLLKDM